MITYEVRLKYISNLHSNSHTPAKLATILPINENQTQWATIFFLKNSHLSFTPYEWDQFNIDLEDERLSVHRTPYKISPLELDEAKKQIQSMLEDGFISPSDSSYSALSSFSPEKNCNLWFCTDCHWLNKKNIKVNCPLPSPQELFDRLHVPGCIASSITDQSVPISW